MVLVDCASFTKTSEKARVKDFENDFQSWLHEQSVKICCNGITANFVRQFELQFQILHFENDFKATRAVWTSTL